MAKNPCAKDCANRSADCHGNCEAYKEFCLAVEAERKRRRLHKADEYAINYTMKHKWK